MMSKFYVGQKVLVTGSTRFNDAPNRAMIGRICEIRGVGAEMISVYNSDKTDFWIFNPSDLQPITETPETLTINGVEYVRKPAPVVEHEWKFGDVATHEDYGVGIVTSELDGDGDVYFKFRAMGGLEGTYISPSSLTFIRRADLSV